MLKLHRWPDYLDPEIFFKRAQVDRQPQMARKTSAKYAIRHEVTIKTLMQQGLTRWEAEQQWEWGLW